MKNDNFEIDNFLRPDLSKRPKPEQWNFFQAAFAALGLTLITWAFLWLYFFVTAPAPIK